jgi:hypothetical protein
MTFKLKNYLISINLSFSTIHSYNLYFTIDGLINSVESIKLNFISILT